MNTLGKALMFLGFIGLIVMISRIAVKAHFDTWNLILYLILIGFGFYLLKKDKNEKD